MKGGIDLAIEARKIQMTGGSTYLVTLPKQWVKESNLKVGDVVFFTKTPDGGLYIQGGPHVSHEARRAKLEVGKSERREHLLRRLIGAYVAGNDLLEVDFKGHEAPEIRKVVREFARMVIGPEILEESKHSIVIQDLSDLTQFSQEKCLRWMHLTIKSMHEEAIVALKTLNGKLAHDVISRDDDIDRLYWMVAKQFNLMLNNMALAAKQGTDLITNSSYRQAAKVLERIGDHAQRIAANVLLLTKKVDTSLMEALESASIRSLEIFDKSFASLLNGDVDDANSAIDSIADLAKNLDEISERLRKMKGRGIFALAGVLDSIQRTAHYSTDLAEIAINLVASRDSSVGGE